jgi:hypothetical protein
MVAIGNHSYRPGNKSPIEIKHANILYGVWAMFDGLGLA